MSQVLHTPPLVGGEHTQNPIGPGHDGPYFLESVDPTVTRLNMLEQGAQGTILDLTPTLWAFKDPVLVSWAIQMGV